METKGADLSGLKINRSENNNSRPPGMNKYVKWIIWIIVIAIIVLAGFFVWQSFFESSVEVKLTTVVLRSPSESSASLTASGYVVAQRKASVASKGTGRLVFLGVVEGDKVLKGEIIARLENDDVKAQLNQAKANLKVAEADLQDAERNYNRQKELFKSQSASQQDVDAAESNYLKVLANIDVAKAMVEESRVAMENTIIRAPFDGTVLTKNADVGEIVAPFAASASSKGAVVTIADMSSLQVEADVSESNIEQISVNQDCEIILDAYPDVHYAGYVAKIVPTADRTKATVTVKVGFKKYDSRVLPEMSAKVLFLLNTGKKTNIEEKPVLSLPTSAIVTRDNKSIVYLVKDNTAEESIITTGRQFGGYSEVTSGLEKGERVINNVSDKIKDGIKVRVVE
jgi:RND family efflux transporter MFP subunit